MPRNREDHSNPMNGRNGSGNKKPGMNMKKVFAISFCIVLGIVFISGGVIYKLGHDLYSSVNYVADDDVKTVETLPDAAIEETLSTEERTGRSVDKDELSNIQDQMKNLKLETKTDDDIYNVLLVGVDRQDKTWNGNSDAMILVSINKAKNHVSMISLMRDTYVDIDGAGYAKLNAAYAYGAGPLPDGDGSLPCSGRPLCCGRLLVSGGYHRYHRRCRSGDHGQRGRGRKWIYQ